MKSIKMKLVMWFLVIVVMPSYGCLPKPKPDLPSTTLLFDIHQLRDKSERAIIDANNKFKDSPSDLQKARESYNSAGDKGNAFIDVVKLQLTARSIDEASLTEKAKELTKAVNELYLHVNKQRAQLETLTSRFYSISVTGDVVSGAIEGLAKAAIVFIEDNRKAKKEIIDDTKKEFDTWKWKPSDKVTCADI